MNIYEHARQKYAPDKTRVLIVAEAPPESAERFFYYENVKDHDALFVNLMRALYGDYRHARITEIRKDKQKLLKRFRDDGFYLIDALLEPISLKLSSRERERLIAARADDIVKQVKKLHPTNGTILIKKAVFHSLYEKLSQAGLAVKNHVAIPFPSSGHQKEFQETISGIANNGALFHKSHGWDPIKAYVSPILYMFGDNYKSMGTLTIIRPGLAITAKHVIEDHLQEHGITATAGNHSMPFQLLTYQLSEDGLTDASWFITNCFFSQNTDIAYLKLAPANQSAADIIQNSDQTKVMTMDLESPAIGSSVYGFGYPKTTVEQDDLVTFNLSSHTTGGVVENIYRQRRDNIIPFPALQISARIDGGMSGGPVFNEKGSLVGIMSVGLDGIEYSHVALLWPSMSTKIVFDRADYPELNGRQYPIIELARDRHLAVNDWRNITITTDGDNETVAYRSTH
ncbi:MAG: serine protease [Candidatus Saccharimonadales bacterium]